MYASYLLRILTSFGCFDGDNRENDKECRVYIQRVSYKMRGIHSITFRHTSLRLSLLRSHQFPHPPSLSPKLSQAIAALVAPGSF